MVSTLTLVPILRELVLPLIFAVPGNVFSSGEELTQKVDLIELNHFYDDLGRHAYDQVIFYEWSPDYRRYHVIAWAIVEDNLSRMPEYDPVREATVVRWIDRDTHKQRLVWSELFRETWSQTDPERANKKLLNEKYRVSLVRAQSSAMR